MLRKLLLGSAAALALVIPAVSTSTAQAGGVQINASFGHGHGHGHSHYSYSRPYRVQRYQHDHYRVWYRKSCYQPWSCYGTYGCERDACGSYDYLRGCGYEVRWGY